MSVLAGSLPREERAAAYDSGIRDMIAHLVHGAPPPRSPWRPGTRRAAYYREGARRTAAALRPVVEALR